MNKIYLITLLFLLFLADTLLAFQAVDIPLIPEAWEFKPQTVEFLENKSKPAMRLLPESDEAILKDFDFTNGTIEFDIEFVKSGFAGISFRRSENGKEAESFYLRIFEPFNPLKRTTLQYATVVDGMSL